MAMIGEGLIGGDDGVSGRKSEILKHHFYAAAIISSGARRGSSQSVSESVQRRSHRAVEPAAVRKL